MYFGTKINQYHEGIACLNFQISGPKDGGPCRFKIPDAKLLPLNYDHQHHSQDTHTHIYIYIYMRKLQLH